jgi:hypothetical protein
MYPQFAPKKIETIPEEDPRGNFIEKNKTDILNEYTMIKQMDDTQYRCRTEIKHIK